jgi:adenosylcobinamide-GDP ribazoletransferase
VKVPAKKIQERILQEIRVFLIAIQFYTRVPVRSVKGYSPSNLNHSTRYFPLVGLLVGALAAGVYHLSAMIFPYPVAVILSMIASILVTGAFHEDGFADACDGFGGGWTREKILEIMKDSRMGAFGVLGLVMILLLKFSLLSESPVTLLIPMLIAGHALSRLMSVHVIWRFAYSRDDLLSKVKPIGQGIKTWELVVAWVTGLAGLLFLPIGWYTLSVIPLLIFAELSGRYYRKWLGGYTGDCLGATQQVSEILFYIYCLGVWRFT